MKEVLIHFIDYIKSCDGAAIFWITIIIVCAFFFTIRYVMVGMAKWVAIAIHGWPKGVAAKMLKDNDEDDD